MVSASLAHGPKIACRRRAHGKTPGSARSCAHVSLPCIRKIEHRIPYILLLYRPSERSRILPVFARMNTPRGQNHESGYGIWRGLRCCANMLELSGKLCTTIRASLRINPPRPSPERALSKSTTLFARNNSPRGQNHESGTGIWRVVACCAPMREPIVDIRAQDLAC
jgi:hypothetical protein